MKKRGANILVYSYDFRKYWVKQLYARFTKIYKSFRSSKAQKNDMKQGMGKRVIRKIYKNMQLI